MKKILAFILAVLSLLSVFAVTASAAAEAAADNSVVMQELSGLQINGKPFVESDYPVDTSRSDLTVLCVAEVGFKSKYNSDGFGLYLYLYNPGCVEFEESENDYIQIGLNMVADSFKYYGLKLVSKSKDNRFLKYQVTAYGINVMKQLWSLHENSGERVYNIPGFKLVLKGALREYVLGRSYIFNGYDFDKTLQCSVRDSKVIEVELHATTWVSPNAGTRVDGKQADEFDHYEIHSVYFAIDKQLLNDYGYISSIRANYDSVKLTPIVVTRPGVFDDTTKGMILGGKEITKDTKVLDLLGNYGVEYLGSEEVARADWIYSDNETLIKLYTDRFDSAVIYNCLAYYFENEAIPENFDLGDDLSQMTAFSSEELEAYFNDQLNVFGVDLSALYREYKQHLNIDYTHKDLFNLKTYTMTNGIPKKSLWQKLFGDDDSYLEEDFMTEIKKIEVIENPALYSNMSDAMYSEYSKKLVMNACDLESFSNFCKEAAGKNQAVVILRYAIADYRCTLLTAYDPILWIFFPYKTVGYSIEKSAMLNVSVAQIAFTSDKGTVVIPTVSNSVNSFGDGVIFDIVGDLGIGAKPEIKWPDWSNWWKRIQEWLDSAKKIIALVLMVLVLVALVIVVICLLSLLIRTGTAMRESRQQRRQAREEIKKQKNARRR